MGVSTDAILVYGIPVKEEDIDAESHPEGSELYRMLWDGNPVDDVDLIRHCSDNCTMFIAGISSTHHWTWRGQALLIPVADLHPGKDEWDEKLSAFIDRNKLTAAGKPGWYLASWWG
jgi:hypothetical protein